jgi:mono/diheme cytochrome c family protein
MKAWGIILAVTILFAVASWFVYSGIYSVTATQPHTSFERWLLITLRDQSIEQHAGDVESPLLNDATLIQTGARHYGSTCAVCHGAPGQELSAIVKGLNPVPPELHTGKIQKKYSDAEL